MTALFTTAMALQEVGPGLFDGELNHHWCIGPKVHGGAMLALCANAARMAGGGEAQPVAVSASFLFAPDPGSMRLKTAIRKRGRRISVVDVELSQDDRTAVHAVVNLGEPEHYLPGGGKGPLLSANPVVDLMPPEPPGNIAPIGPGHPMAGLVHLGEGCDIRPLLSSQRPVGGDAGPSGSAPVPQAPVFQMWARPRGVAPDPLFALMCGDLSVPVTFAVERRGWAPTIQLTAYLRGMPSDGWLRVTCTCLEIGQDWFDEDHLVVDSLGRVVVQSRQLALVPLKG